MKHRRKLSLAGILLLCFFLQCRKAYVRRHFEGKFNCTDQYVYDNAENNTHNEGVLNYTCTVSIYEGCLGDSEDDEWKTLPIRIQTDGAYQYHTTEVSRKGEFTRQSWDQGSFSGGYSDDNHFSFSFTGKNAAGQFSHQVTAVRQ